MGTIGKAFMNGVELELGLNVLGMKAYAARGNIVRKGLEIDMRTVWAGVMKCLTAHRIGR